MYALSIIENSLDAGGNKNQDLFVKNQLENIKEADK